MKEQIQQLCEWYGDGSDGSSPTAAQWNRILAQPLNQPITLINFFKLRKNALYDSNDVHSGIPVTGSEAFDSYATVSIPTMQKIGGKFLHVGPFSGTFLGNEEDWDMVAIGVYPNLEALLALYTDEDYRRAFTHRTAACERQTVLTCANFD